MSAATDQDPPNESSAPVVLWVAPLLAAIVMPGLQWTATEPFAFRFDLFFVMTSISATVATAVVASLSRGFRRRIRWSLGVTTAVMITLFMWPQFALVGGIAARKTSFVLLRDVLPVALAVALLWLTARLADTWQFVAIAGPVLLITAGVLVATALSLAAPETGELSAREAADGSPDVLLLVLDGYGRADVLEDVYGFDSTEFLTGLEDRGFDIAAAASANYSFTYAAVASMLEMDYVFDEGEVFANEVEVLRSALTGGGNMTTHFRRAGYEIAYLENAWGGSYCGDGVDWCVRDGLFERSLWGLGQMTVVARLLQETVLHPFNSVSMAHLESLPDILNRPHSDGRPRFTFAHLILPHPPYLLDAQCGRHSSALRRSFGVPSDADLARQRRHYSEQTSCTNDTLLDVLDEIIDVHSDVIVMVTADHGPPMLGQQPLDVWPEAAMKERMTILSAYRLPGCAERVRPEITPVNGARLVTNCALGTSLEELPDVSYWTPSRVRRDAVVDLTNRLEG